MQNRRTGRFLQENTTPKENLSASPDIVILIFSLQSWFSSCMRGVGPLLMLPSLADASGQEYHQVAKSPCYLPRPQTPPSTSSHSIFLILTLHLPRPHTLSSPFSTPSYIVGHPVRSSLFVMHVSAASLCDGDAISATRGRVMPPVYTAHHGPLALLSGLP